jgi:ferrochelatase
MTRTAVILFNLGGPDSPEAVKPFLFNLFSDPAILRVPNPLRHILAKLISGRRNKIATDIYAKIGGRSPILDNTQAQARALERTLSGDGEVKCFVTMRYWYPFAEGAAAAVKKFAPDRIVLVPLYPQFSTTTTASSFKSWRKAAAKAGLDVPTRAVCCYPEEAGFIRALTASTRAAYGMAKEREPPSKGGPRILFSAHGLPEKIVRAGDPYPVHCGRTAGALVGALNIPGLDHVLCYQSRVGPLKWIGPATDDEIRRAGRDKVPVVVVPIAFVSEHSETLVELDIEYRHLAERAGVPFYARVPVVGTAPDFIEGLAGMVRHALESGKDCVSASGGRICDAACRGCPAKP